MILVDTSVCVDHLRRANARLTQMLERGGVLAHPLVIGELAMGNLKARGDFLRLLSRPPFAIVATEPEVRGLVERRRLFGLGLGWVDAHLLASARLTADASLWSRDHRLAKAGGGLGVGEPA